MRENRDRGRAGHTGEGIAHVREMMTGACSTWSRRVRGQQVPRTEGAYVARESREGEEDRGKKERKEDREVVSGDRAGTGFRKWGRMAQAGGHARCSRVRKGDVSFRGRGRTCAGCGGGDAWWRELCARTGGRACA